ncbi:hypothetical protein P7C73_g480, partial [Tremellales sp. Uapishka_1]
MSPDIDYLDRTEVAVIPIKPKSSVFHRTLTCDPVFIESYLYFNNGAKMLDACGGAAVINIGHARPAVTSAMYDQLQKVSQPAEELAAILNEDSGMERAVFFSSGSEAMEAAIKLARQYHVENGQPQRVNFIAREQSYHGNTLGYESTEEYVQRLADELDAKILSLGHDTVAAFVAEPVVGATSGTTPAVPGYFAAIRRVCDKYGVLLVLDEIMCGMGRTGKMHAWMHHGVQPDIEACGKALSGGYAPLSALLISSKVVDVMQKGSGAFANGHTYQNSALGCRAGLEVQKIVRKENL